MGDVLVILLLSLNYGGVVHLLLSYCHLFVHIW